MELQPAAQPPIPRKYPGRPRKLQNIDLAKVTEMAKAGVTNKEMGKFFRVSQQTWCLEKIRNPEFREAVRVGEEEATDLVENALFKRATGYEQEERQVDKDGNVKGKVFKIIPPDPTSMIFWLKNRRKKDWRDIMGHDVSGQVNQIIRYHKTTKNK